MVVQADPCCQFLRC